MTILSPEDGDRFQEQDVVRFEGAADDAEDGTLPSAALAWASSVDGEIGVGSVVERDDLAPGMHTVSLTATDTDGGSHTASVSIEIEARDEPGNQRPNAVVVSPPDSAMYEVGQPILFAGQASDPEEGALTGAALVWSSDLDDQLGTGTSFERNDLSLGIHTVRLIGTDSVGLADTATTTLEVLATPPPNQPPSAMITLPSDGGDSEFGRVVNFEGHASDPEDGILVGDALVWSSDLAGQIGTGTSFQRDDLAVGIHTIVLVATDSHALADTVRITHEVIEPELEGPAITAQPQDLVVDGGDPATFSVTATGTEPIVYQWLRDGVEIEGAIGSSYEIASSTRADSGVAFSVRVSNEAGEIESDPVTLEVVGITVFGLSGFRPIFPMGPNDLTGIRYRVEVVENESQSLRLIFGFNRLYAPETAFNYLIETNVYSGRLAFPDGGCTTWPLLGDYHEAESSLRLAIPDYAFHFGQQPGITTGIKTGNPAEYPVQSYLIDNIPNLYKSDAISQFDMDGLESFITLERGGTTTDVTDFERCDRPLEPGVYRIWRITVETQGAVDVVTEFVLPDEGARYLTVSEAMNFLSEFIHGAGSFTVQYWDFGFKRESDPAWRPVKKFVSQERYDGNGSDFGVRVVESAGDERIEFSNRPEQEYIRANIEFAID